MENKALMEMSKRIGTTNSYLFDIKDYFQQESDYLEEKKVIDKAMLNQIQYSTNIQSKIHRSISHSNNFLSQIKTDNLSTFFESHFDNQTKMIELLENNSPTHNQSQQPQISSIEDVQQFGQTIGGFSEGIINLSNGLLTLGVNSLKVLPLVGAIDSTSKKIETSIYRYLEMFGEDEGIVETTTNSDGSSLKVETTSTSRFAMIASNLDALGKGIYSLGINSLKAFPFIGIAQSISKVTVKTINYYIDNLSDKTTDIDKIGGFLSSMSTSLLAFGGALVLSAPLYALGVPGLVMASLSINGFVKMMQLSGLENSSKITANLLLLSGGVLAFGGSLALLSAMNYDVSDLLLVGSSIVGFGGVFMLLDKFKSSVIKGGLTLGVMSLGIYAFSKSLQETKDLWNSWEEFGNDMAMIGLSIGGFAGIYSLLGLALPAIIPGVFGIGLMSGGIYVFSKSLQQLNKIEFEEGLGERIKGVIIGISDGITSLSVKDYIKLTASAAPFISLGITLKSLATGLQSIAELESKYKIDYNQVGESISNLMRGIKGVFEEIGISANSKTSLLKVITGGDFSESNFEQGVESVSGIGKTLNSLVTGVASWADFKKKYPNLDINVIANNIKDILGVTYKVFEEIGNTEDGNLSFTKLMLGDDLATTAVGRGIQSVKGLGDVLESLATGVESWANLETKLPNFNAQTIANNIKVVLNTVSDVFREMGKSEDAQGGSLLKRLTGADFGKTDVERGILAVKDTGSILDTLATGIIKWNSLDNMTDENGNKIPFNRDNIMSNIKSVLTVLPDLFRSIGEDSDNSMFRAIDKDITKGLKVTKKFGIALNSVISPISKFDKISNPKAKIDTLSKGYNDISTSIRKIPNKKLKLLKDLLNAYNKSLTLNQTNDNTLNVLLDKIKDILELNKQNETPTLQPNENSSNIVNTSKEIRPSTTISNVISDDKANELINVMEDIYDILSSGLKVKNYEGTF